MEFGSKSGFLAKSVFAWNHLEVTWSNRTNQLLIAQEKEYKMRKNLLTSMTAATMMLFLVNACAEESTEAQIAEQADSNSAAEVAVAGGVQSDSLMDQPVNFSTPEDAEKTLQNIRDKEGDGAHKGLLGAMEFIMFYDLSVGNNKEKMYQKLNGMPPREIIAGVDRWGKK